MQSKLLSVFTLIAIVALQLPAGGQTSRRPARNEPSSVFKSVRNDKLAAAFETGQLPEPLRKPEGKPDEVAAVLAKTIAIGDDRSTPALLTAIMTAGFGIRDNDGGLTQTVQPGQGLVFEAWEIAAMAKMYGELRTVELAYLSEGLKAIPELKDAPLETIIINGIRKQANGEHPELRFWARFIVELGKQSSQPYDLLNPAHDKRVRLDAIQHALILRRLMGDLYSLGQRSEQALKRVQYAHAPQSQPCRLSEMEAIIEDLRATITTTAFGEMMSFLERKLQDSSGELFKKYGKFIKLANILLAYAKFIATYAALETEITVENPPLVRNTDVRPGERRKLVAKVSMNIGKAQQVNCFRWLLNAGTGMDFNLMNDGPLEGVEVTWHLAGGGTADFYHSGDREQRIVWFAGTGPRIQDAGTYAGIPGKGGTPVGNLTRTKTDAQGDAHILLEGASRRSYIPAPRVPVMKQAVVRTTVKLKGGDIKGDAVDLVGQMGSLLTLPAELLYRTDWASTATIEVPVKDWEPCDGGWYGTITYTEKTEKSSAIGSSSRSHNESIEVKGNESIAEAEVNSFDIYEPPRPNVRNSCQMFRRHFWTGSESRKATVRVLPDEVGDGYKLFVTAPAIQITKRFEISACGHGNKTDQSGSETEKSYGLSASGIEGKFNSNNRSEISGTANVSTSATLTWNLKRCQ